MYRLLQVNEKQKKSTTTSINKKDNKCINEFKKGKNSQRISKIQPFIGRYN